MSFSYHKKYYQQNDCKNSSQNDDFDYVCFLWLYELVVIPSILIKVNPMLIVVFFPLLILVLIENEVYKTASQKYKKYKMGLAEKPELTRLEYFFKIYDSIMLVCMLLTIMLTPFLIF